MTTTPRPDPRRPRTRRAILDATTTLLTGRGIADTSIADIAEQAGVSVGSIYGHFGSKDQLLLGLVDRAIEEAPHGFEPPAELSSPLERVLWFGEAWLELAAEAPVAARVMALYALEPPALDGDDGASPTLGRIDEVRMHMRSDLDRAASAGELGALDADAAFTFLVASWNGVNALVSQRDDHAATIEQARAALALTRQLFSTPEAAA